MIIWVGVDLMQLFIFPFIWLSIYGSRTEIAGYARADIVTYYIVMGLIAVGFTSHIARHVRVHIMKGDINKLLLQPVNVFLMYYISEAGYKSVTTIFTLILGFFLWLAFPQYLLLPENIITILVFALSLLLAFMLSQFLEYLIGLTSFWMGETRAIAHALEILKLIFAGAIAPLTFFPETFQYIANLLPFKFMGYIPAQIYLGNIAIREALLELTFGFGWLSVLGLLIYVTWKRGVKKYEGVGI